MTKFSKNRASNVAATTALSRGPGGSTDHSGYKNALISVSDKSNLEILVPHLKAWGTRVVSTGGSARHLRELGLHVIDVSEQTNFPEVMDGRVKTLHPRVHMALLARADNPEDQALLKAQNLELFDLVIANLYPFENGIFSSETPDQQVELIDVGGPSMLRAAAKNFSACTVVVNPQDYAILLESPLDVTARKQLAAKVFAHTSAYDALVAEFLGASMMDADFSVGAKFQKELRYGENPQQKSVWFRRLGAQQGLHNAKILQGKELSHNNLLDLDAAIRTVQEFSEPCCVAVKHNNPCGIGLGRDIDEAVARACQADPVSIFGGVVALNRPLTKKALERFSEIFLECLIATEVSPAMIGALANRKNLRVLEWPSLVHKESAVAIKSLLGGLLVQTQDRVDITAQDWVFPDGMPSKETLDDLWMAWKVAAHLKSNSIALVKDGQSVGLGMGQVNRVDAVEQALERWRRYHPQVFKPVLASDAFFPFPDSVELAARGGIEWIIQPGGSLRDEEVFATAKRLGVRMVLTRKRHFSH